MASLAAVQRGVEGFCERVMTKRSKREFLSSVGPFLLVVTFIEDGLRIFLRWSEQMHTPEEMHAAYYSRCIDSCTK